VCQEHTNHLQLPQRTQAANHCQVLAAPTQGVVLPACLEPMCQSRVLAAGAYAANELSKAAAAVPMVLTCCACVLL